MKTGRNEKCPCGSGKKYKQCCLRNEELLRSKIYIQPDQYFGYVDEDKIATNSYVLDQDGLVCMVCNVTNVNCDIIREESGKDFQIGDWYFSTGAHANTVIHGPFKDQEDAFNQAHALTGVENFKVTFDLA